MDGNWERKIRSTLEFHKILENLQHHAATLRGKAAAQAVLPSTDLEVVKSRLQETDEAVAIVRIKGSAPFQGVRDIRQPLQRAKIGGMLNPRELLDVATTVSGGRGLKRFLASFQEQKETPSILARTNRISDMKEVEKGILSCIDEQADVMDHASVELRRIRQELRTGEARIREKMEQMIRNQSTQKMLQEQLITLRNDRYVIPVKQEYRNHFGGIVHDQSSSGATLFMEPEVIVQLNNRLRELVWKEEKEIEKILQRLTLLVAEHHDDLVLLGDALEELDFIFAKAGLSTAYKATLPLMNDRGFFRLKRARHPLISTEEVVPTSIELGNDYHMIVVTGPNTGGKTVSLKTVGLLHLMAMSGLFVPAEDGSQLCVFDGIYADIGDEQSIEQNLSTFSSHMTNIIGMLRNLTPRSLVLLDELGAGTDPAEGSALAISILEHLRERGCRTIATTHYSELKAFAYDAKGIINASMEFDVATLRPTYRLLIGVPGRSNAFAIAERLGLDTALIERARKQLSDDEKQVDTMIASLEANRLQAEKERQEAELLREEAAKLKTLYEKQQEQLEREKEKLLEQARQEARHTIDKAKKETESIISDLRKMALEEQASIKEHKLIATRKRLEEAEPDSGSTITNRVLRKAKSNKKVKPGDEVFVPSFGKKGHVVEEASSSEWTLQLGMMKMKVKKSQVELVSEGSQSSQGQKIAARINRSRGDHVRTEIDLRGSNLEEAIIEVDQFLDEAILANLGQVQIIHGKGTGVLRSGMQDFLRKHKHVKHFRYGEFNEGGNGVTIAELH